jgi:NO-binding membrane sensor protein with MHYT domain
MYTEFFQLGALPTEELKGLYNMKLVMLSYFVAVMASYVALDLTGRLRDHTNTRVESLLWVMGGAIAMGAGIWAMHFIGMLSFTIPGLTLEYDLFWTGLSLVVAILASGFALLLLRKSVINVLHLVAGGFILGLAIAAMHYTGMTGLLISLNISYLPVLFLISIIVAILASIAAIWLALKSNTVILRLRSRIKFLAALIMGVAICGMHYIGMSASVFSKLCVPSNASTYIKLEPSILAMVIAGITLIILAIAFLASNYKDAKNQQLLERSRGLGAMEISASVLHNVGNVLNSINVSLDALQNNRSSSPLSSLPKLADLLNSQKENLANFLTKDPQGQHILEYIEELAKCWERENKQDLEELQDITKNITLIKNIITTQQAVVKVDNLEQIVSIDELIEEALVISGIYSKKDITIEKDYGDIKPFMIDHIKLFQVLNNIISNGKDALIESPNENKKLIIKSRLVNNDVVIEITDNGIGIDSENLQKIFNFGFTTKKTGHGFGLHASALTLNQLGGGISVNSAGLNQGTAFTIRIPYRRPNIFKI